MQVEASSYGYSALNNYQKPSILPIELPDYSNKEIYEASDGNIIRGDDGKLHLTPQGQTNLNNAIEDAQKEVQAQKEQEAAATREFVAGVVSAQSKKTQAEIYLAVASDGKYSIGNGISASDIIKSLRDVQEHNNFVQAYAAYAQNQQDKPVLY